MALDVAVVLSLADADGDGPAVLDVPPVYAAAAELFGV